MSVRQGHAQASVLGPGRTRVMIEGVAAMIGLAALSVAVFSLLTWGLVQLVLMLAP